MVKGEKIARNFKGNMIYMALEWQWFGKVGSCGKVPRDRKLGLLDMRGFMQPLSYGRRIDKKIFGLKKDISK